MQTATPALWGIRSGERDEAHELFMRGFAALDTASLGDLSRLGPDRVSFKQVFRTACPDESDGAINQWAGQYLRFVHEVATGDLFVYPSKTTGLLHLGRTTGTYRFDPHTGNDYAHVRPITWLAQASADSLPVSTQKGVGTGSAFFSLRDYPEVLGVFGEWVNQ